MPEVTDPKTGKKKHFTYDARGRKEASEEAARVGGKVTGGHHPGRKTSNTKRAY
jgi:hypothetical protein